MRRSYPPPSPTWHGVALPPRCPRHDAETFQVTELKEIPIASWLGQPREACLVYNFSRAWLRIAYMWYAENVQGRCIGWFGAHMDLLLVSLPCWGVRQATQCDVKGIVCVCAHAHMFVCVCVVLPHS